MKINWTLPAGLSLLALTSSAMGQAQPVIDLGSEFLSGSNFDFTRAPVIADPAVSLNIAYSDVDFLVDGNLNANYSGPSLFGGVDASVVAGSDTAFPGTLSADLFRVNQSGGPSAGLGDFFNGRIGRQAQDGQGLGNVSVAALYWAPQSEFIVDPGAGNTFALGADTEMQLLTQNVGTIDELNLHFVVNNGGQLYVSERVFTALRNTGPQLVELGDGTDFLSTNWAPYTPATGSLDFDNDNATFQTAGDIGFNDVQGLGVYLDQDAVQTFQGSSRPVFWNWSATASIAPLVSGGLVGDYNDSGSVEQGDLDLVLGNWGQPRPFDANGDPFTTPGVDQEELDRVLGNWGNSSAPSSAVAVPEPASLGLLAAVGAAMLRRRLG